MIPRSLVRRFNCYKITAPQPHRIYWGHCGWRNTLWCYIYLNRYCPLTMKKGICSNNVWLRFVSHESECSLTHLVFIHKLWFELLFIFFPFYDWTVQLARCAAVVFCICLLTYIMLTNKYQKYKSASKVGGSCNSDQSCKFPPLTSLTGLQPPHSRFHLFCKVIRGPGRRWSLVNERMLFIRLNLLNLKKPWRGLKVGKAGKDEVDEEERICGEEEKPTHSSGCLVLAVNIYVSDEGWFWCVWILLWDDGGFPFRGKIKWNQS